MNRASLCLTALLAAGLCFAPPLLAQKGGKGKKPGGGGGTATVIPLGNSGYIEDLTETVAGIAEAVGGGAVPMHWLISAEGAVLATELSTRDGAPTIARGVNSQGMIVGAELDFELQLARPLFWASASAAAPLELPHPENVSAFPWAINDEGLILGRIGNDASSDLIAWKVTVEDGVGVVEDVRILDAGPTRFPAMARQAGFVAFTAITAAGDYRAMRLELAWDGSQIHEVPGSRTQLFDSYSTATAVNNFGVVAGELDYAEGIYAQTLSGDLLGIPSLPGGRERGRRYEWSYTFAEGINDHDEIVAWAHRSDTLEHTNVLAIPGGAATDVRDLANTFGSVRRINNAGWIAGRVHDPDSGQDVPAILIAP